MCMTFYLPSASPDVPKTGCTIDGPFSHSNPYIYLRNPMTQNTISLLGKWKAIYAHCCILQAWWMRDRLSSAALLCSTVATLTALAWNWAALSRVSLSRTISLSGRNRIMFVLLSVISAKQCCVGSMPKRVFSSCNPSWMYLLTWCSKSVTALKKRDLTP